MLKQNVTQSPCMQFTQKIDKGRPMDLSIGSQLDNAIEQNHGTLRGERKDSKPSAVFSGDSGYGSYEHYVRQCAANKAVLDGNRNIEPKCVFSKNDKDIGRNDSSIDPPVRRLISTHKPLTSESDKEGSAFVRRERTESEQSAFSGDSDYCSYENDFRQCDAQDDLFDGNGNIQTDTQSDEIRMYEKPCQNETDLNGNVSKEVEWSRSSNDEKCTSQLQAYPSENDKHIEDGPNKSNINFGHGFPSIERNDARLTQSRKSCTKLTSESDEEKRKYFTHESDNESISSINTIETIKSKENDESEPFIQSNNFSFETGSNSDYSDRRIITQTDNNSTNEVYSRETDERNCSNANSNDSLLQTKNDPDDFVTARTIANSFENDKNQSDNAMPRSCTTSESESERYSDLSAKPSTGFINAKQEQHTRLIDLSHDDIDDHSKHSLTVNVDTYERQKEVSISLPFFNKDGRDERFEDDDDDVEDSHMCCGVCRSRYSELYHRLDSITNDYQRVAKKLEETMLSTRDLKVFKSRATKVIVLTVTVTLSIFCVVAAFVVVRDQLGDNGSAYQVFGRNITTLIADLQEQYVSVSDMVNDLMTRSKSVIHLTNGGMMARHGGNYFVRWVANENHGQGSLELSKTGDSIMAPTGGYYRICAKMHYKATMKNATSIKLKYDLVRSSGGYHEHVRHAVREFPAASGSLQYELQLDTTLYVYPQDAILVSVRPDQIKYLADFDSAHEFSMLEVG